MIAPSMRGGPLGIDRPPDYISVYGQMPSSLTGIKPARSDFPTYMAMRAGLCQQANQFRTKRQ
ncbi:MAG: hypothetical protein COW30_16705 [Rhodospirillales bacterium CG15_BIG_FIL_POST_REV_8_21_14_020_66_15]|nr:MAG: hypothetical protein COW30_16705 [Rhodospirillales bacterium CG15_BIG_FIL_POST_REV_8_21_14_020_66_15]